MTSKLPKELMKIMGQSNCIAWAIEIAAFDQMDHAIVEHVQNRK